MLTHAARAAAKQLNKVPFQAPPVAARGAREGLWLEQILDQSMIDNCLKMTAYD